MFVGVSDCAIGRHSTQASLLWQCFILPVSSCHRSSSLAYFPLSSFVAAVGFRMPSQKKFDGTWRSCHRVSCVCVVALLHESKGERAGGSTWHV
jgi:hypothetical protein